MKTMLDYFRKRFEEGEYGLFRIISPPRKTRSQIALEIEEGLMNEILKSQESKQE